MMKTYIIRNSRNKKIYIKGNNLNDAIESYCKIKDAVSLNVGDWVTTREFYNRNYSRFEGEEYGPEIYKIIDLREGNVARVDVYRYYIHKNEIIFKTGHNNSIVFNQPKDIIKFNSGSEAMSWLKRQAKLYAAKNDLQIKDSVSLNIGDWFTTREFYNRNYSRFEGEEYGPEIYKIIDLREGNVARVDVYRYYIHKNEIIFKTGHNNSIVFNQPKDIIKFNSGSEAMSWLKRQAKLYAAKNDLQIKDSIDDSCYDIDIAEYQKWVDYDMKTYGHISEETNEKLREAGLEVVRDEYGDYEVIAKETHDDIEKSSGGWVNRGKEGTHGKFATKEEAREQQKAMFARGYKADSIHDDDKLDLAQKWIDYDMKRYGKISEETKQDIEKMGFQIVKIGNEYSVDLKDK